MTFGQKLQQLRRARGLSQEDLAQQLSVTRQTISKWELDQSTPDLPYLAAISEYFGVTTDYLIKEDATSPDTAAQNWIRIDLLHPFPLSKASRLKLFSILCSIGTYGTIFTLLVMFVIDSCFSLPDFCNGLFSVLVLLFLSMSIIFGALSADSSEET